MSQQTSLLCDDVCVLVRPIRCTQLAVLLSCVYDSMLAIHLLLGGLHSQVCMAVQVGRAPLIEGATMAL